MDPVDLVDLVDPAGVDAALAAPVGVDPGVGPGVDPAVPADADAVARTSPATCTRM